MAERQTQYKHAGEGSETFHEIRTEKAVAIQKEKLDDVISKRRNIPIEDQNADASTSGAGETSTPYDRNNLQEIVEQAQSPDPEIQMLAVTQAQKLLSSDQNPLIDDLTSSGILPILDNCLESTKLCIEDNGNDGCDDFQVKELDLKSQRSAPIILDIHALERAMNRHQPDNDLLQQQFIPNLESILQGKYLLSRLRSFFGSVTNVQRRGENGKLYLPAKEFNWSSLHGNLTITFKCYPILINGSGNSDNISIPQTTSHLIRMQFFICPKNFRLITKLEYSGQDCPAESDVRIFERYFASQVAPVDNEMAVLSFVSLCRSSSQQIFSSLAQIMLLQMNPSDYPWRIDLELLHTADEQRQNPSINIQQRTNSGQILKNVLQSVMITEDHSKFLFIIYLYPNNVGRINVSADRRRIVLCYHIESNELTLWHTSTSQQPNEFDQRIADTIKFTQSEVLSKQNEEGSSFQRQQCVIWPCIRALLEGKHQ